MERRVDLDGASAEAEWAHRLAREMLFARVMVSSEAAEGDDLSLWTDPMTRALNEALGGDYLSEDATKRFGYLLAALTAVGFAAVMAAGQGLELAGVAPDGEGSEQVMPVLARVLDTYGERGKWL